ncbi:ketopantoate reductase family protein [Candidatus Halobonum tyrrellensis]|uniref:2-dehydropantoate 2-reductase n=1 Tax=Candidatus Halobonum tyrrellensis G22 TaxID=1324957 RepID=V4HFU9_9EURY|nr:ketopantoate reductase family protein [Candidatus Halobonum tyrrellensis]ESP89580.1 2-dehydropantoate 2-reductase [Candidatus Halobonum tyrrellensis G22]
MNVVVFGAGSLGSLVGGLLARDPDHRVTLVGRAAHVERVRADGLRVSGELDATTRPEATTDGTGLRADLALVTVKAYDTASAAAALATGDVDLVCSLQNGLVEEVLEARLGDRVLAGTATYGAELVGPGHVRCTGVGAVRVGELDGGASERAERVARAFRAAGLDCTADAEMPRSRWEKLAVNAGVNAVTALARVDNGALRDPPGADLAARAARETARVARANGVDLADDRAVDALTEVVEATAANRSSMRQDVEAGRRTEADAINGAVADRGAAAGVETPVNRTLAALVRTWETENAGQGGERGDGCDDADGEPSG